MFNPEIDNLCIHYDRLSISGINYYVRIGLICVILLAFSEDEQFWERSDNKKSHLITFMIICA